MYQFRLVDTRSKEEESIVGRGEEQRADERYRSCPRGDSLRYPHDCGKCEDGYHALLDNCQPFYAKSRRGQVPQNGCDYHSQDEQGEFLESENLAQCVSFVFRHIYLCVYG